MQLFVGISRLQGPIERYAERFDMVEVNTDLSLPRPPRLAAWRAAVPESFVFSLVVPRQVAALESGPEDEPFHRLQSIAEALGAGWLLLITPSGVSPTPRTRERFGRLVDAIRRPGRRIAWEPRGPWSAEQAESAARELGVHLVVDLARADVRRPPGDVVYTRLRALGRGARLGAPEVERVAEALDEASEAFVIVEGAGPGRVRQALRDHLDVGEVASGAGEERIS